MTFQQVWKMGIMLPVFFTFFKIFLIIAIIFFGQARRACQRQRSILLEFDTRGEVEDFQRLVGIFTCCQKLSDFITCALRWGMSTLVWNPTNWSGLESLTSRSPNFFLFSRISLTLHFIISSWGFATNTTWWTPAWCSTSHQMWRDKGALIVPILSQYYLFFLHMSK